MSSLSEKSMLPLKFLSCLIAVSVFLLIISSLFLLQFCGNSLIHWSVSDLILVNSSSIDTKANPGSQQFETYYQEVTCQNVSSSENLGVLDQDKSKVCDPNHAILRVYMYDLPPEFHFGLLGWSGSPNQTWPDVSDINQIPRYPGGLNSQHSPEYWLTLDLLSSNTPKVFRPCSAIRVLSLDQADVIFVPFFSSLSYNRNSKVLMKERMSVNVMLQNKLVEFLMGRDEWKRLGGKDHLIVAHHPNSMLSARKKLGTAMFVLSDFGRYSWDLANLEKDVIAPYKHMVKTIPAGNSAPFDKRPILAYFQGAIYRKDGGTIRQELYYLLKNDKDVHFTFGSVRENGVNQAGQGMGSSKFCLNIAGDTPSSNRLFDAIVSQCIPVIISDAIELPYEDVLDYSEFCLFVRSANAVKKGFLLNLLRGITKKEWTKMWERLKEIGQHFEYQYPSQPVDAVDMIWRVVARKISSIRQKVNRENRYSRFQHLAKIK